MISNELIRWDDLKSQQNEIEEKLGQAPVEPEQKVLVREDTEGNNRGRRVSVWECAVHVHYMDVIKF